MPAQYKVPIVVAEIRLLDWIKGSVEYGSLLVSYCTSTRVYVGGR